MSTIEDMFFNKTFVNTIKRYCRTDRYLNNRLDLKLDQEDDECMRIIRKQEKRLDVILHCLESYTNAIKSQRQDYFNYIKNQIADTKLKKAFERGELDQYIKICEDEDDSWFDELCVQVRRNYVEHRRRVSAI